MGCYSCLWVGRKGRLVSRNGGGGWMGCMDGVTNGGGAGAD